MFKYLKLRRFRNEIISICEKNGYKMLGDICKCRIDDGLWTFVVITQNKHFLVKLFIPFGHYNTGLCFNSQKHLSASATIFAFRGMPGSINIPMFKEYSFNLPDTAFDVDANITDKIYLVFLFMIFS